MSLFSNRGTIQLAERVSALESELATIKLAHAEVLDKVYKWMHRAIARQRRDEGEPMAQAPANEPTIDPVSARLLARRARHVPRSVLPEQGQLGFDGEEVR